ncbi:hypothetical protein BDV38DRAFT_144818 [Aspergillus pseudotamarii]|uniref:Nephrocystin 3-like N-terminal domain-containing protein n=1 Tax=Aspergillus pseudotamarii TaxID=132259 RepID=A0A5N6SMX1_ASPPS|nr:uncharacterized protein BDV38DRAFT_144818 [Aspergillus pseudotamarii]KAE8135061.1 hypothetical protein BDV38DRAFT_144818 [Aspergillus pseudotamarii]
MVIKYLRDKYPSAKVPVLLAFFNFCEGSTQTPANVVRSLLAQLLRQSGRVSDMLMALYERYAHSPHLPLEDLWSTLHSDIASFDRVFIIFDALDEYVYGSEGFVNDFQNLFKLPMTSLFVTSRPTSLNKAILGNFAQLEILARDSELREYIQTRLSESRFNNRPELCNEVVQTILHQSNGV